jgi:transcriptional regulator with XRE-family HTH domain
MTQFGDIIAKFRKENGFTQAKLAEMLYVSPQAVSKWENNQSEPDLSTIQRMAELFRISPEAFFVTAPKPEIVTTPMGLMTLTCEMCGGVFPEDGIQVKKPYITCKKCKSKMDLEQAFIDKLRFNANSGHEQASSKLRRMYLLFGLLGLTSFFVVLYLNVVSIDINALPIKVYFPIALLVGGIVLFFVPQLFFNKIIRRLIVSVISKRNAIALLKKPIQLTAKWFHKVLHGFARIGLFTIWGIIVLFSVVIGILVSPITYFIELRKANREVNRDGI